jgi:hypothetical protein
MTRHQAESHSADTSSSVGNEDPGDDLDALVAIDSKPVSAESNESSDFAVHSARRRLRTYASLPCGPGVILARMSAEAVLHLERHEGATIV